MMTALQQLSPTWRYSLLAGLASIPVTLALNWQNPGGVWDASGIALCALAVGYLAKRRGLESTPVGLRTGAIGAIPVLYSVTDVVPYILDLVQPAWFTAVQLVLVALTMPVLVGVSAVVGALSGRLGGWLAERRGHRQGPATARS